MSEFFKGIAERNLRKSRTMLNNLDNVGIRIPFTILRQVFLPWQDHRVLPQAGGILDQDPDIMDALELAEYGVAWWEQNLERKSLDELPELE